ncbi:MAG TPA: type II CAAX endopeptidase family protein [Verrucomicrobiae bacterium]|nr:type II CAAX endopeptidase family protein [Verrucomicrobiae bacterium]
MIALILYECLVRLLLISLASVPAIGSWLLALPRNALTPGGLLLTETVRAVAGLLSGLAMCRIEDRGFADYGLPLNQAFGKRFWQGSLFGMAMLTLLLGSIGAFGGFSLGGLALAPKEAVYQGLRFALAFLLVGLFEESVFRGYVQATLAPALGFWPAALLSSVLFGAWHIRNPGETPLGLIAAGSFGLLAAFSLWRTGSIWFAIAMHASWDWAQTFLFGVPDSGAVARGHFANSLLHGPDWLTGGTAGPEGSLLIYPLLLLAAAAIHFAFSRPGRPAQPESSAS